MTAKELRRNRIILGYQQQLVAKMIGVSPSTIGCWERDLYAISHEANAKLDKLLYVTEEQIAEYEERKRREQEFRWKQKFPIAHMNGIAKEKGMSYGKYVSLLKYYELYGERRLAK